MEARDDAPLSGLRVVELAAVLAGPSVGSFLAELGAEVTKVENARTGGDVTRGWRLPGEAPDAPGAYYASANYGKTVRLADLRDAGDRAWLRDAVAAADVVLSSFRPGADRALGLDAGTLMGWNPGLVLGRIHGYGPDDPRPAYDLVLQAETGWMAMTGAADGPPAKLPVALVDVLAAHQLKEGLLLALWQRARDGRGRIVDVALRDASLSALANQASNWLMAGHVPGRLGSLHPNIAPYGETFPCADGLDLVLAVGAEAQFRALCAVLDRPELPLDARFRANADRVRHRAALAEALAPGFAARPRPEWLRRLTEAGVPAGAVRTLDEVFADPAARAMVLEDASGLRVRQRAFRITVAGASEA